jgi:hypothetical protein
MFKANRRTVGVLLCCAATLLLTGCATTQGGSHLRRGSYSSSASECPGNFLRYCKTTNQGRTCGCMPTQEMEKILRAHP